MPIQVATAAGAAVEPSEFRIPGAAVMTPGEVTLAGTATFAALSHPAPARFQNVNITFTGATGNMVWSSASPNEFGFSGISETEDTAVTLSGLTLTFDHRDPPGSVVVRAWIERVSDGAQQTIQTHTDTTAGTAKSYSFSGSVNVRGGSTRYRLYVRLDANNGARTPNRGFTGPLTVSGTVSGSPTISQDFVSVHHIMRATDINDAEQIWSSAASPDITSFTLTPDRYRIEDAKGANRLTARWAVTGATTRRYLTQHNIGGSDLTIPLANNATEHTGLTIPDDDAQYAIHVEGAAGNNVRFADFVRTRDVAITAFTARYLGQLPAGVGNIIGRWQLNWTVRGWPRPTLTLETNDHTSAPTPGRFTAYAGARNAETGTGQAVYQAQIVAGVPHLVGMTLSARNAYTNASRSITVRTS